MRRTIKKLIIILRRNYQPSNMVQNTCAHSKNTEIQSSQNKAANQLWGRILTFVNQFVILGDRLAECPQSLAGNAFKVNLFPVSQHL